MIKQRHLLIILFALLSMVQARADVEINATNFPDEKFRNYLLSEDYGSDGVITDAEIAGVTSIEVSDRNIVSLKGIEYFTALTDLSCYKNQLTTLDVSNNMALTTLNCGYNQLTSLNVLGCTALEELSCFSNLLTSLNVSSCTALTVLSCFSNMLPSLNVSSCTALTVLSCDNNQLTSLDVSKNTALVSLECATNLLTSLDVSKNTALQYLYCYQNQIKGAAMDALIASLPTCTSDWYVILSENEGNVMTSTQVAAAKTKGWKPMCWDYAQNTWQEYAGSDSTGIKAVESDALGFENGSDIYFDLSGRRVMTPQKGVFVKNGKKVAIK